MIILSIKSFISVDYVINYWWPKVAHFLISNQPLWPNRISNTGCRDTVYIRYISLAVSLILRASMVQARVGADYDCN